MMPDNDILCQGISRRWGGAYTQFVQWQTDLQSIARSHLVALKGELKSLGNPPVYHLRDQSRHFLITKAEFLRDSIKPVDEYEHIKRNAQSLGGNKRGMDIARNVSIKHLTMFLEDGIPAEPFYRMTRSYIETVYASSYVAPVQRFGEMSEDIVNDRLSEIRPFVNRGIDYYTKTLVRTLDVNKIRLPRGLTPSKLKSGDDLDDFLNASIRMS